MKHFLILGNGCSGSSLLQALLNEHSKIEILFEDGLTKSPIKTLNDWRNQHKNNIIWGNKMPLEQFIWGKWNEQTILNLIDEYYIIFNMRTYTGFDKSMKKRQPKHIAKIEQYWLFAKKMYWAFQAKASDKVFFNLFEDLIMFPTECLQAICKFLDLEYESKMLNGVSKQKIKKYPKFFDVKKIGGN